MPSLALSQICIVHMLTQHHYWKRKKFSILQHSKELSCTKMSAFWVASQKKKKVQSIDEAGQGQEKGMALRKCKANQTHWHWICWIYFTEMFYQILIWWHTRLKYMRTLLAVNNNAVACTFVNACLHTSETYEYIQGVILIK